MVHPWIVFQRNTLLEKQCRSRWRSDSLIMYALWNCSICTGRIYTDMHGGFKNLRCHVQMKNLKKYTDT